MARKLRLEFPGACYHVINRGNYRSDIFRTERTKSAFVTCLFEACAKSAWLLHAFVVMRNHYHLAIETPEGNLVLGMKWLQATFANRFNGWRQERGHVFQGRYKALLVQEGDPLGLVCHYIHLNPVPAFSRSTACMNTSIRATGICGIRGIGRRSCDPTPLSPPQAGWQIHRAGAIAMPLTWIGKVRKGRPESQKPTPA
jgi:REP element-mobilizing transposase RayT